MVWAQLVKRNVIKLSNPLLLQKLFQGLTVGLVVISEPVCTKGRLVMVNSRFPTGYSGLPIGQVGSARRRGG